MTSAPLHGERFTNYPETWLQMPAHGYYWSAHWRNLRRAALERDGHCCTVSGCYAHATVVDHIVTRPRIGTPTPADRLDNLRSLCKHHDAQIKERRNGQRTRGGQPVLKGVDASGWPKGDPFSAKSEKIV